MNRPATLAQVEWAFREVGKANQSKVRVLRAGPMVYRGEAVEFSTEDLQRIAAETRRLIHNCERYAEEREGQTPWTPPILREHNSRGSRDGDILGAEVSGDELFVRVQWRDGVWSDIQNEEVEFVSVGIRGPYQDMRGEEYSDVIWEVSLTSHPVRKDIGRIQDTITLSDGSVIKPHRRRGGRDGEDS